ncbi:MAG: DNA polymerase III subunit epsilon [Bacteroidetes bacterium GWF2_41_61]|jgi:DNA polymerase-3 subunit epsilon|nr:MAG: DNA polymerase III subunit epsilon [Bacteroidetes bacterium GWE2_40_15]OFY31471.1 MAG: DNA polymerase III subunit epsilon [Bacteroidetes bacterium GWF2_41_61]OFY88200.1 MAG: DNA polymerase III subunit epsilon [Bacteroidetes bacterium RIFOXYA12_FULL_40_10]PKP05471.1 MAG: DNA polymerase III subunit epsilon [Bacteroidetes bacterium HGW-Bacteroidetes-5]HBG24821.1 DNA polymerase III subunit epsilon [Rikenellaceae bacterium]
MKLNLKNPLLFFDIESTGLNVATDRIVELSALKVMPNGDQEIKTRRINPTIPISPEAQSIHGISNEDVANCPTFKEVAKSLATWMSGCDFSGYNATKFDIPMLAEEFLRAGVSFDFRKRRVVDVQNIFHKLEQRTLSAAYKFYCSKELENAHSAEADTVATFEILEAQLDRYKDILENDVKFLADFSTKSKSLDYAGRIILDDNDVPIINFGKHKGRSVESVFRSDAGYYSWMMNGEFTLDTKQVITELKIKFESSSKLL